MANIFEQVKLSSDAAEQVELNNYSAGRLHKAIAAMPDSREKSLAITKLEECVMWANKAASRTM